MHANEKQLLKLLSGGKTLAISDLEMLLGADRSGLSSAIESLSSQGAVAVSKNEEYSIAIGEEGKRYMESGFPEQHVVKKLMDSGGKGSVSKLDDNIGVSWAKRNGWIEVDSGTARLTSSGRKMAEGAVYGAATLLSGISRAGENVRSGMVAHSIKELEELQRRKLVEIKRHSSIRGVKITDAGMRLLSSNGDEGIGQLSREMITAMKWQDKRFKPYDVNAQTEKAYPARLHPLHEFIARVRGIWLNMGFAEVSGPIIESAFWNFDALFSPQDHPTRDMQDTFFLSNPRQIEIEDLEVLRKVKRMHQKGWGEKWRESLARQALLRTHLTSVSARHMKKFGSMSEDSYPVKLFSIGRAFRNESVDYKHLAEFYQTDGIVIGNGLTLSNLMHIMKGFYSMLGIDAKFMPSYFPFVEPGLQVYYYDEKLKDNVELNGAGIIRREISKAMGTSKTVLAWGIGIERPMFNFIDMDSIAELYKNDIGWLRQRRELKG